MNGAHRRRVLAALAGLLLASCGGDLETVPTVTAADVPRTTAAGTDGSRVVADAPTDDGLIGSGATVAADASSAAAGTDGSTGTDGDPADAPAVPDASSSDASSSDPEPGSADPSPGPDDAPPPSPEPADVDAGPSDARLGPTPREVAALVAAEVAAAGDGAQHVVADLDGDGIVEVVVAGVVEDRAGVEVWFWRPDDGFGEPVALDAGPGRAVTDVLVAELTGDDDRELLVRIGGGARDSLAVWSIEGPGSVSPRPAVGGCFAGTHVYGATSVRLQARAGRPPAILATCDDTPLPVADWSTAVYEFRDGAFRFVAPVVDEGPIPADGGPVGGERTDGADGATGDGGAGGDTGGGEDSRSD